MLKWIERQAEDRGGTWQGSLQGRQLQDLLSDLGKIEAQRDRIAPTQRAAAHTSFHYETEGWEHTLAVYPGGRVTYYSAETISPIEWLQGEISTLWDALGTLQQEIEALGSLPEGTLLRDVRLEDQQHRLSLVMKKLHDYTAELQKQLRGDSDGDTN